MMKKIVVGGMFLALAGCTLPNLNPSVATPSQADIAINAFDAAKASATNYLSLPVCGTGSKVCRTQSLSVSIAKAVRAGTTARDEIYSDLKANASVSITVLQTLEATVSTLQTLNAQQGG